MSQTLMLRTVLGTIEQSQEINERLKAALTLAFEEVARAERRATVERIRLEIARSAVPGAHSAAVNGFRQTINAILDEEAAR